VKLKRAVGLEFDRTWFSDRTESRNPYTGFRTWGIVLFGAVFVAFGSGCFYFSYQVGTGNVPQFGRTDWWPVLVFGALFFSAGLGIWALGIRQIRFRQRCRRSATLHPGQPAFGDYPWDTVELGCFGWPAVGKAVVGLFWASGLSIFFNFVAFHVPAPSWVRILVLCLDLGIAAGWVYATILFFRSQKFGKSRILFETVPYRLGEQVVIRWTPARGIRCVQSGKFTLCCIKEAWIHHRKGRSIRFDVLWQEAWEVEQKCELPSGAAIVLQFLPPKETLSTSLNGKPPQYWELHVDLNLPGIGFRESYLVPIYSWPCPDMVETACL
jgi:hypothetical protein